MVTQTNDVSKRIDGLELAGSTALIVDDDPATVSLVGDCLASHGMQIIIAPNGQDAFDCACTERPDIVLLDVRLPSEDGYAICHRIRRNQQTASIPVLFMSALRDVTDKLKGFAAGGLDYITKPIEEAELLARVSVHLQLSQLRDELEDRNERLIGALDTGNVVNVAIGILMERHRLTRQEALEAMRRRARSQRRKLHAVADELLGSFEQLNLWRSD